MVKRSSSVSTLVTIFGWPRRSHVRKMSGHAREAVLYASCQTSLIQSKVAFFDQMITNVVRLVITVTVITVFDCMCRRQLRKSGIFGNDQALGIPGNIQAIEEILELPRHLWKYQAFLEMTRQLKKFYTSSDQKKKSHFSLKTHNSLKITSILMK